LCVKAALSIGTRGLRGDMTLSGLLAENRSVRTAQHVRPLSTKQIIGWIDAYYRRHRKRPTRDSGAIPNSGGETWTAVDLALKRGRRGLAGRSSLAKLIGERKSRMR
jgi:hypothetical protein